MEQVLEKVEEKHAGLEGAKMGMWLFLFTELLLFGGLFAAYAVILITSSLTVALGVWSAQTNRKGPFWW